MRSARLYRLIVKKSFRCHQQLMLTEICLTCINNYMPSKVWDQITYPFPNINGCTVEVWEWINNFIPRIIMKVINSSMLGLKLYLVNKRGQCRNNEKKFGARTVNSLWPCDTTWQHRSGSRLVQLMVSCITVPSLYPYQCWLHMRAISQKTLKLPRKSLIPNSIQICKGTIW